MIEIRKTNTFNDWLAGLTDATGKAKILVRIERLRQGNPGKVDPVGEGVSELKIDYGPGYRVYYKKIEQTIVLLLCGGDKSTQARDIKQAKKIAKDLGSSEKGD